MRVVTCPSTNLSVVANLSTRPPNLYKSKYIYIHIYIYTYIHHIVRVATNLISGRKSHKESYKSVDQDKAQSWKLVQNVSSCSQNSKLDFGACEISVPKSSFGLYWDMILWSRVSGKLLNKTQSRSMDSNDPECGSEQNI